MICANISKNILINKLINKSIKIIGMAVKVLKSVVPYVSYLMHGYKV